METTALVLIDLQHSNVARTLAPHSAQQVVENSARLAHAVRTKGGTVATCACWSTNCGRSRPTYR